MRQKSFVFLDRLVLHRKFVNDLWRLREQAKVLSFITEIWFSSKLEWIWVRGEQFHGKWFDTKRKKKWYPAMSESTVRLSNASNSKRKRTSNHNHWTRWRRVKIVCFDERITVAFHVPSLVHHLHRTESATVFSCFLHTMWTEALAPHRNQRCGCRYTKCAVAAFFLGSLLLWVCVRGRGTASSLPL